MLKAALVSTILALSTAALADSVQVVGAKADNLVNAFVGLGHDQFGTHEYMQIGVSACSQMFDEDGDYFGPGSEGRYIGEACMVYGDSDMDMDEDDVQRTYVLIPKDDPTFSKSPELKAKFEKIKALRLALEALVVPVIRKETVNGREIVATRTSGIAGLACEGRTSWGQRTCQVLPSHLCPIR